MFNDGGKFLNFRQTWNWRIELFPRDCCNSYIGKLEKILANCFPIDASSPLMSDYTFPMSNGCRLEADHAIGANCSKPLSRLLSQVTLYTTRLYMLESLTRRSKVSLDCERVIGQLLVPPTFAISNFCPTLAIRDAITFLSICPFEDREFESETECIRFKTVSQYCIATGVNFYNKTVIICGNV